MEVEDSLSVTGIMLSLVHNRARLSMALENRAANRRSNLVANLDSPSHLSLSLPFLLTLLLMKMQ
jgi:hypothetical protein